MHRRDYPRKRIRLKGPIPSKLRALAAARIREKRPPPPIKIYQPAAAAAAYRCLALLINYFQLVEKSGPRERCAADSIAH